ncbi:hypothetical protein AB5I41_11060 [Sphingomonas sp. MMS24-JH45]
MPGDRTGACRQHEEGIVMIETKPAAGGTTRGIATWDAAERHGNGDAGSPATPR